jgi:hypothetical protein
MHSSQVIDPLVEERIVLGIASIIQAIPDETKKLLAFEQLLSYVKNDIECAFQLRINPGILNLSEPSFMRGIDPSQEQGGASAEDVSLQIALRALRCLSSSARGMQAITESPIDLELDPIADTKSQQLVKIQSEVMNLMVRVQCSFNNSGEVVETICNVLRAGFSETEPSPFLFSPEMISEFFIRQNIQTPRIGTVLSTACSFLSSLYKGPSRHVRENLSRLLPWVVGLLQTLPSEYIRANSTIIPNLLQNLKVTSKLPKTELILFIG